MGATPSPYSVMTYGGSHPHMPSGNPPQPPPYDECMKTAASMQAIHMSNMDPSTNYGYVHYDYRNHLPQQQHQQQSTIHERQTSLQISLLHDESIRQGFRHHYMAEVHCLDTSLPAWIFVWKELLYYRTYFYKFVVNIHIIFQIFLDSNSLVLLSDFDRRCLSLVR